MRAVGLGLAALLVSLHCSGCCDDRPVPKDQAAQPSAVDELPRSLAEVEAWNRAHAAGRTNGASLAEIDRSGVDLTGVDISSLDLRKSSFAKATLVRADLRESRFDKADLREADLREAKLDGAILDHAQVLGVVLTDASAQAIRMRWVDLREVDLRRVDLREADLRGTSFVGAVIENTQLDHCDLRGADLRGVDLSSASMAEVDLRGAKADDGTRWPATIADPLARGVELNGVTLKQLAAERQLGDR